MQNDQNRHEPEVAMQYTVKPHERTAVVLIPACSNRVGAHEAHTAQRKYVDAVFYGAQCTALLIPAMGGQTDIDVILEHADGVFLSGSPSNVNAELYGETITQPHLPQDVHRDDVTIPLIQKAVAMGIPIMGVCRGFQEINVAMGGTLHQAVHDVEGLDDHREDKNAPLDDQYGAAHPVHLVEGGMMSQLLGKTELMVNSIHGQGINRLGDGLTAQAYAPDGLIEAFCIESHTRFGMAVQWHPEWKMYENPDALKLFEAFGNACRSFRDYRRARLRSDVGDGSDDTGFD